MALNRQNTLILRQSKGNNSSTIDDTLMKFDKHHHNMVIYTQYKLHEIPSIAY